MENQFVADRKWRLTPLLLGLAVVLGAGALHGVWTERWHTTTDLEAAVARLDALPDEVAEWRGQPFQMDERVLRQAGAEGHWLRRFSHTKTGATVTIVLLCGRTGQMAVHRPEDCYRGAGYEIQGAAVRRTIPPIGSGATRAEVCPGAASFWTAPFHKENAVEPAHLRIFWSWLAEGGWQAPESPRLAFAGRPVLYKLYAIREMAGPREPLEQDPCLDLLGALLPEITKSLGTIAGSRPSGSSVDSTAP